MAFNTTWQDESCPICGTKEIRQEEEVFYCQGECGDITASIPEYMQNYTTDASPLEE